MMKKKLTNKVRQNAEKYSQAYFLMIALNKYTGDDAYYDVIVPEFYEDCDWDKTNWPYGDTIIMMLDGSFCEWVKNRWEAFEPFPVIPNTKKHPCA